MFSLFSYLNGFISSRSNGLLLINANSFPGPKFEFWVFISSRNKSLSGTDAKLLAKEGKFPVNSLKNSQGFSA